MGYRYGGDLRTAKQYVDWLEMSPDDRKWDNIRRVSVYMQQPFVEGKLPAFVSPQDIETVRRNPDRKY